MRESRHRVEDSRLGKEAGFCLGGRDSANRLEQAAVVKPVDPFERGELDSPQAAQWPAAMDDLVLERPNHVLASAVSWLSPTLPAEGSIWASARRSVHLIEAYCAPRSPW